MELFDSFGHLLESSVSHADGSESIHDHFGTLRATFHPTPNGGGILTNAFGVTIDTIQPSVIGLQHIT